jgi:hypothetical protein
MSPHEEAICDCVIRRLEAEAHTARGETTYPEIDKSGPPVECRVVIGCTRFAIEHTLIEPFAKHVESGRHFEDFVGPLRQALDGALPKPGYYKLHFVLDPLAGLHRRKHDQVRSAIVEWVKAATAELVAAAPTRRSRHIQPSGDRGERRASIHGIDLWLIRELSWVQSGQHDGRLGILRVVEGQEWVETMRVQRIKTALDKKCGKLTDCNALGDVSVLVLENNDFSMSNEVLVSDALKLALEHRSDCPDRIFLIDTTIDDDWELIPLVSRGVFLLDEMSRQ